MGKSKYFCTCAEEKYGKEKRGEISTRARTRRTPAEANHENKDDENRDGCDGHEKQHYTMSEFPFF